MSTAPCGHADAECVVGNFWTCKSCGGESKAQPSEAGAYHALLAKMSPDRQARLDQLTRDINAGQIKMSQPRLTVPAAYDPTPHRNFDACLQALFASVLPKYRAEIAPGIDRSDEGYGTHTAFVDSMTGQKGIAKHNKMFGVLKLHACLVKGYMLDQVANEVDHLCRNFVQSANASIDAVVQHRGWSRYRLATLGEIMHLVVDDGLAAQYTEPGDGSVETRVRGYWVVVPV